MGQPKNPGTPAGLREATERLRARNDAMAKILGESSDAIERIAEEPEVPLNDATARAKKFWDELEAARDARSAREWKKGRSSLPPPRSRP